MAFDPTDPRTNNDGATAHVTGAFDRLPPQNIEAEQGVIGSIFLSNAAMHDVAPILKPEDFFRDAHREIYLAALDLYDRGKPFDVVILAEAMGDRYRAIDGDRVMARILESVPHAAHAGYYAAIVRQKARSRALIDCANEILRDGYSNNFTAEQLVESAERRVFAVADDEATGDTLEASQVITLAMGRLDDREQGESSGIETGFADLDDLTDGLLPGNLIIVAARPSVGKTSLALNIAEFASTTKGVATLLVSLEMNRIEVGERLLSSYSRVDNYRFKNTDALSNHDRRAICEAEVALRQSRMFIDDTPIRTVTQIAANARRLRSRHNLGLVIVDYIQLIDGQRLKGESRQEEVARVSKRLKGLARELELPVVCLAQLNRESERRDDRRPRLADLRESGQIEADADVVILLHRPDLYDPNDRPGEADMIVAKNRNGATGTVRLVYLKHCTRFESMAPYITPRADVTAY
jgi:replicative DNA helicase